MASGQVSEEDLTRDVTDLAGVFPPLLSRAMVAKARAQLGLRPGSPASVRELPAAALSDLAGSGTLNPNPGWGPYRTAGDAELRTYTSAEFAYRRGDHPHEHELTEENNEKTSSDSSRTGTDLLLTEEGRGAHGSFAGRSPMPEPATPLKPVNELSQEARVVLNCFRDPDGQPLYYEDFSARIDMAPQSLLAALTELSLASYIDLTMDQQYVCAVDLEEVWPA